MIRQPRQKLYERLNILIAPRRTALLATPLILAVLCGTTRVYAADLAIIGAKVYPSPEATPLVGAVVLIKGDRIVVVRSGRHTHVPAGFKIIDAHGGALVAGFWNCHVHLVSEGLLEPESLSDEDLSRRLQSMFVRWGFTTIFDLASTMKSAGSIRDRVQARNVTGPRILTVAEPFYPSDGTPVYANPIYEANHLPSAEITDTVEAVRRVDTQIGAGADGIKLFTASIQGGDAPPVYMPAADVRAITAEAHRLRRQVFAHPTDAKGMELAVDNGVDILAHVAPLGGPWSPSLVAKLKARHVWFNSDAHAVPGLSQSAHANRSGPPPARRTGQSRRRCSLWHRCRVHAGL